MRGKLLAIRYSCQRSFGLIHKKSGPFEPILNTKAYIACFSLALYPGSILFTETFLPTRYFQPRWQGEKTTRFFKLDTFYQSTTPNLTN